MKSIPWAAVLALVLVFGMAGASPAAAQAAQTAQAAAYGEALAIYQQGRNLESSGRTNEAAAKYAASLALAERALGSASGSGASPGTGSLDLHAVKCWSLFRLGRFQDSIAAGNAALVLGKDQRIVETMGEASFHLGRNEDALRYLAQYIDLAPSSDERMSSAYFYIGETHLRMKQYEHADIAFSTALHIAPHMARWWYRHGVVLEALGQYRRAWDAFGKALERSPKMQDAIEARARVKAKAGL